jgi:1,4-alpha-glucan branching enzyme
MMGWMHDTLTYMKREPIHRKWHQNEVTFSLVYAFTENFMLPFSHDEVVYGKGSMLTRMTGDEWQRFANLRAMYGYMFAHPGTKLLFMGGEFGQGGEWNFEGQLDWWVLDSRFHKGVQNLVRDLNVLTKEKPALYELAFSPKGFDWVSYDDAQNSVIGFVRKTNLDEQTLLVICNFSANAIEDYQMGVPLNGVWKEILNTDHAKYGGANVTNDYEIESEKVVKHGHDFAISFRLAPLATMIFELTSLKSTEPILEITEKEKPRRRAVRTKK